LSIEPQANAALFLLYQEGMFVYCPYCEIRPGIHPKIVRIGHFLRKSDSQKIQRYRCLNCKKNFSQATFHDCYRQKKRNKNEMVRRLLCSVVSQRQMAIVLNLNRTTINRKLIFLAKRASLNLELQNRLHKKAQVIQFDDLETSVHSKYKPLSVTIAVEERPMRILGFEVSQMPAKGLLAKKAFKKYGFRKDERTQGRERLFRRLTSFVEEDALIKSDSNPYYPQTVKKYFPKATHKNYIGRRGAVTGQGELKKGKTRDPLFSLNHTCAKFRAHISRLIRKTWNTTKKTERLVDHINIYADYHNERLFLRRLKLNLV